MERYHIRVSSDELVFSVAHFIAFADGTCERLHGHDYHAVVELSGPLGEAQYVVDYSAVREILRGLLAELDHRVLLPTEHGSLRVEAGLQEVDVVLGERRWVFPRGDCLLLPLANTTAEALARYLGQRLQAALEDRCGLRPSRLRMEIGEGSGLAAAWEIRD